MKSEARLFQPNLMCSFHRTKTLDGRCAILTVVNKDAGVGVIDEQIIQSLWAWGKKEIDRLKNSNIKYPERGPEMDVTIAMNSNASVFNIIVISHDEKLGIDDFSLVNAVLTFCYGANKEAGLNLNLEGVPNELAGGRKGISP